MNHADGHDDAAPSADGWPLRILFVCTGNICRSPAAALLTRRALGRDSWVTASSAGTQAVVGSGVHDLTARALAEWGIDSVAHRARDLTRPLIVDADLVVTMTRAHRSQVLTLEPSALRRAFTLLELVPLADHAARTQPTSVSDWLSHLTDRHTPVTSRMDVPDPVRGGPDLHESVVSDIAAALEELLGALARVRASQRC